MRNVATEFQVFGFVDHTHAPATDFAEDAIMGNRLPYGWESVAIEWEWQVVYRGKVNLCAKLVPNGMPG